jgi:hypothetical protein
VEVDFSAATNNTTITIYYSDLIICWQSLIARLALMQPMSLNKPSDACSAYLASQRYNLWCEVWRVFTIDYYFSVLN